MMKKYVVFAAILLNINIALIKIFLISIKYWNMQKRYMKMVNAKCFYEIDNLSNLAIRFLRAKKGSKEYDAILEEAVNVHKNMHLSEINAIMSDCSKEHIEDMNEFFMQGWYFKCISLSDDDRKIRFFAKRSLYKKILSKNKIIYKQNSDEIIKHFQLFPEELNLLSSMQYANLLILKKQYEHFSLL